jgi:hypothetical protein
VEAGYVKVLSLLIDILQWLREKKGYKDEVLHIHARLKEHAVLVNVFEEAVLWERWR